MKLVKICLLFAFLFFSSCSKSPQEKIIGSWKGETGNEYVKFSVSYTFNSDGTGKVKLTEFEGIIENYYIDKSQESMILHLRIKDSLGKIIEQQRKLEFISDNEINLISNNDRILKLKKQGAFNNDSSKSTHKATQSSTVSLDSAQNIFRNLLVVEPLYLNVLKYQNKDFIIGITNQKGINKKNPKLFSSPHLNIYLISVFAKSWHVEKTKTIINNEFVYLKIIDSVEIVNILEHPFLYFVYHLDDMGNATAGFGSLYFKIISLPSLEINQLVYSGEEKYDGKGNLQYIKGEFENLNEIKNHPDISYYLESRIEKSKLIYRPTKEDLDLNNVKNFRERWKIDNPEVNRLIANIALEETNQGSLNFTYYKENIFPRENRSVYRQIENYHFVIISLFRYDIMGYDKLKKKYFPIWIDECNLGCNKEIEFSNDDSLIITYNELITNKKIFVDLKDKKFYLK